MLHAISYTPRPYEKMGRGNLIIHNGIIHRVTFVGIGRVKAMNVVDNTMVSLSEEDHSPYRYVGWV